MPNPRSKAPKSIFAATALSFTGNNSQAQDVTGHPAQEVMTRVNLLCDNDTAVLFFRNGGRLFMRSVAK